MPQNKTDMTRNDLPAKLSQDTLQEGIAVLCQIDPHLAKVVSKYGNPPMWDRKPGFATLLHIILEQQVSLASAKAAFLKLEKASGQITPDRFLTFTDSELKAFGFSRQKTTYGRALSTAIIYGHIDLDRLHQMDDPSARKELVKIKGIGPWTAEIYLLMALLRPDIWPTGDLALAKALQKLKNLPETPPSEQQLEIAENWRPWRAVAARIVWHYYLSQ